MGSLQGHSRCPRDPEWRTQLTPAQTLMHRNHEIIRGLVCRCSACGNLLCSDRKLTHCQMAWKRKQLNGPCAQQAGETRLVHTGEHTGMKELDPHVSTQTSLPKPGCDKPSQVLGVQSTLPGARRDSVCHSRQRRGVTYAVLSWEGQEPLVDGVRSRERRGENRSPPSVSAPFNSPAHFAEKEISTCQQCQGCFFVTF